MGVVDSATLGEVLCVIVISLIKDNSHVLWNLTQELIGLRGIEKRARRIIGIRQENNPRFVVDRCRNRWKVKRIVTHGYFNQFSARSLGHNRINDERALAADRLQS